MTQHRAHCLFFILVSLAVLPAVSQAFIARDLNISLRLDPVTAQITATAQITGTPESKDDHLIFVLGESFSISRVRAGGANADWDRTGTIAGQPGREGYDIPLRAAKNRKNFVVTLEYSGTLDGGSKRSDRITPGFVELSEESGFYPVIPGGIFSYHVEIFAPSILKWISTGNLVRSKPEANPEITRTVFSGSNPGRGEIVVIGGEDFLVSGEPRGLAVGIHHCESDTLPETLVRQTILLSDYFRDNFGPPPRKSTVSWVRVPRDGRSYVSPPLFVSPASGRQSRDLSRLAELLASLWWDGADGEAWCGDGLAIYSAWKAVDSLSGNEAAIELRREARRELSTLTPAPPDRRRALILAWSLFMLDSGRDVCALMTPLMPQSRSAGVTLDRIEAALSQGQTLPEWWTPLVREGKIPDLVLRASTLSPPSKATVTGRIVQIGSFELHLPVEIEARDGQQSSRTKVSLTSKETEFNLTLTFAPCTLVLDPEAQILFLDNP